MEKKNAEASRLRDDWQVRPRSRVRPSGVSPRTPTKSNASSIFIGADRGDKMSLWYVHGFGLMIQRG